ncbi:hypothetical protein A3K73_08130 [Candidatus Pacearchaeota archaeon RBG_13_36_9]|nr:MAG: hypothetical protein A3K73_08130 [Candidatus Pacearchaeota archaeon RBG_13_36_9]
MGIFDLEPAPKRTLGIRDKQILYRKANKKCENPACGEEIEFDEMEVGHKKAWSRGGKTTMENSLCLCHRCNKLQGTDSWEVFMKKQGVVTSEAKMYKILENLSLSQLKSLAKKHNIKIKGKIVSSMFEEYRTSPTKKDYASQLKEFVSEEDINSLPKEEKVKKKRKKRQSDFWGW